MTPEENKGMFEGRRILIGVTGSIAAYKAADLVSTLVQNKAQVRVIMTEAAQKFVSPLSFEALSGRPVLTGIFGRGPEANMGHIWAPEETDVYLIAPASANTIAGLAAGMADNIVTSVALVARCPVIVAPAMNHQMYEHACTQRNLKTLKEIGYRIVGPGEGFLACGSIGPGRLTDKETILASLSEAMDAS